ncbi:GroES-like protein [Trametes versicolor FP-101664 SS1]|uniref:GroES-like protein n=1 Tax=Trametes versicolor (strain FP-101664) TaxID=717944 RepID=UPI0004622CC5|nr:GroES-like protein [Trametes versicolor FP-101664 SS1]EIW56845.1 GroES-like protein [Trametes versicolor FP-101664 SS1]
MPSQQKALVLESKFGTLAIKDIDVPKPGPHEVLLRVEAAALNPADWKIHVLGALIETYPCVLGSDAAGTIEVLGDAVQGFAVGDRVLAQGWYDLPKRAIQGTFQQFALTPIHNITKMPSNLSFEAASTIPSGVATAAFPLYNEAEGALSARLPPPWEERGRGKFAGKPFFVLGGASSMGQFALQFARLSGFSPIITTASLHNTELLKSLGATHVLDRKLSPEALSKEARAIAGGYFDVVYDAISLPDTLEAAYDATAPTGDLIVVLQTPIPGAEKNSAKRVHMAHGVFNTEINHAVSKSLREKLPELLESGAIKPNPVEVLSGGLRGVAGGLDRLRNNQVSGVKLVVKPQETV